MSDDSPSAPDPADGINPRLTRRGLLFTGARRRRCRLYGPGAARAMRTVPRSLHARGRPARSRSARTRPTRCPRRPTRTSWPTSRSRPGIGVKVNTVDHNTFQEQINSYLQGKPDDVFTWFAGYRMQFFAQKGLATPIDDVWKTLTPLMPPAMKAASTGLDGHQYFVPIYNYPWAVFYRKSVFKQKGYSVPKTWDQFIALAKKMKAGRPDPDRLHRQGRLAGDGHVRHPQHADQRLPVPRRPHGREALVGQPAGQGRLQPVEGAPAVLLAGRARA